jgi:PIN domain nuclease of toxin-antitoxin system
MKLLLDTHTFIWWDADPDRLSLSALQACEHPENSIYVSVVSLWEMQIKSQLGKLQLRLRIDELVIAQLKNGVSFLPVTIGPILGLADLPNVHRDPFDRLLIAQAIFEDAAIVTADPVFSQYPVNVVW